MKWILIILVVLIAGFGGYIYLGKMAQNTRVEEARLSCIQKYEAMPQAKEMLKDVSGFCGCQAASARGNSKEEIKELWTACNDKFVKPGMMESCMAANAEINPQNVAGKGVNCQCFYDNLMGELAREEIEPPAERRNQLSTQAFMACRQ